VKLVLKIVVIGVLTTVYRIIAQLFIPNGAQTILQPSIFVLNGTMPIVFTIYGIFAYSIIAALYIFVEKTLSGNKIIKGLKYSITCVSVWLVYLLEPLPHVNQMDKITYPIADSTALLFMGLLLGLFCSKNNVKAEINRDRNISRYIFSVCCITVCFSMGRLFQYLIIDTYSFFENEKLHTILWVVITGLVIAVTILYLKKHLVTNDRIKVSLILGCMLFGIDLLLFNFFIPLVFSYDIRDLLIRSFADIISITIGVYIIPWKEKIFAWNINRLFFSRHT
jgi:hypothetical protein